jgi:hypothetical protein
MKMLRLVIGCFRLVSESYVKNVLKVRRYICRVWKMKFQTRGDIQAHIKDEHPKIRGKR